MLRPVLLLIAAIGTAWAQTSGSWPGAFAGDGVKLEIQAAGGDFTGSIAFQGRTFPLRFRAVDTVGSGSVEINGQSIGFTVIREGSGVRLAVMGETYRLSRTQSAATPAAPRGNPVPAAAPAPSGIVGYWRNATGWARFNADGTGVIDGTPGRYQIRGDQLLLSGAEGQVTAGFSVSGDVLTLTVGAATVTLDRVREEAGQGSVRPELVGKWCWINVTTANQGALQSSRCIVLSANGAYTYAGQSDTYNPNGSAASQSSDSGTWTATETTLTAHSRTGKTTTYRLEKRNHPKNTRDPMIVLDGQPFVTATARPAW
jgi:hypothetical protein